MPPLRQPAIPDGLPGEAYMMDRPVAVILGKRFGPVRRLAETAVFAGLVALAGGWVRDQVEQLVEDGVPPTGWQIPGFLLIGFPLVLVFGVIWGKRHLTI